MSNKIAAALVAAPLLLTACAGGPHRATAAPRADRVLTHASCERTIYHTADYDKATGLNCARLLGLWD